MRRVLLATAALVNLATPALADDCPTLIATTKSAYRMYMDEMVRMDALPPLSDASTHDQKIAWLSQGQNTSTMGHWMLTAATAIVDAHCVVYDLTKMKQNIDLLDLALKRGNEKLAAEGAKK